MRDRLRQAWGWVKNKWQTEFTFKPFVFTVVAFVLFVVVMIIIWKVGAPTMMVDATTDLNNDPILSTRLTLTVGAVGALSLAIVGLWNFFVNHRRANTAEKQQSQELFVGSIRNLGDESEIIKIGAIHGLEQLAKESSEVWSLKVSKILCDYIRSTTAEKNYQIKNISKPAQEIITILNTLSAPESNPFDSTLRGLLPTPGDNPFDSKELNLNGAYLMGVNLWYANLTGVNLREANLTRARLASVDLTGATLMNANLTGAQVIANLSGASLWGANLIGAFMLGSNLTGATLLNANLTGAEIEHVTLTGANLYRAKLEGLGSSPNSDRLENKIGNSTDLSGCNFGEGEKVNLDDIYCGVLTQGLYDAIIKDRGTDKTDNEDRYRAKYSVKRQPTETDKERLVGNKNVGRCEWGDIYVLRDEGVQEGLELG